MPRSPNAQALAMSVPQPDRGAAPVKVRKGAAAGLGDGVVHEIAGVPDQGHAAVADRVDFLGREDVHVGEHAARPDQALLGKMHEGRLAEPFGIVAGVRRHQALMLVDDAAFGIGERLGRPHQLVGLTADAVDRDVAARQGVGIAVALQLAAKAASAPVPSCTAPAECRPPWARRRPGPRACNRRPSSGCRPRPPRRRRGRRRSSSRRRRSQ